jgi:hypothetical protein
LAGSLTGWFDAPTCATDAAGLVTAKAMTAFEFFALFGMPVLVLTLGGLAYLLARRSG